MEDLTIRYYYYNIQAICTRNDSFGIILMKHCEQTLRVNKYEHLHLTFVCNIGRKMGYLVEDEVKILV